MKILAYSMLLSISFIGCKSDRVKIMHAIAGQWQIKQVNYQRVWNNQLGPDSIVVYPSAGISFGRCNGGCNGWYSFDLIQKIPFTYSAGSVENGLFINVGGQGGIVSNINPRINLNGSAIFIERTSKKIVLTFNTFFNDANGHRIIQSYKGTALLVRE